MTYHIVVALSDAQDPEDWIALAARLLPDEGEIHLCGMIAVEAEKSLSEGALAARTWRDVLYQAAKHDAHVNDEVEVHVDYQPLSRVLEVVNERHADLLLVQWENVDHEIGGMSPEDVFERAPCDVVLVNGKGWKKRGNVLLSLRGGPNITLGVRVAQALAGDGSITLFHAADHRRRAPDLDLIRRAVPQIARTVTAETSIADGIVSESVRHKMVVMGASFRKPEKGAPESPPIFAEVSHRTGMPVALVRAANLEALDMHAPAIIRTDESLSVRVDRWFAENTFHSGEFSDLRELMNLKEKKGTTISIALPALNEAKTVGGVIDTLKKALMDDLPLVDEIVLIDSDSTDDTVAIAQSKGIPTFKHPEILAESVGTFRGKGEALWKSLHVTNGDIVVWVDTDITNIHPRFVYGLIGPLLKHSRIQYVKGFYARPIQVGDQIQAYGGGRVTELVARPLLNLFYPELSGILQPLSGEYAGRRAALEQLPFFTGYGVETGMLLDMHERYGLNAIAQTDLEKRVHHNQPLVNLSKMAFAILQVFFARIESRYSVELLQRANRSMKLVIQEPERFALDIVDIGDVERTPMITVPEYAARYSTKTV